MTKVKEFPFSKHACRSIFLFDQKDIFKFVEIIGVAFGVKISIQYDVNCDIMTYDMNTYAKSHLYLEHTYKTGEVKWKSRYDKEHEISNLEDVLYAVKDCMHGLPTINPQWLKALEHYGIIKVNRWVIEDVIF